MAKKKVNKLNRTLGGKFTPINKPAPQGNGNMVMVITNGKKRMMRQEDYNGR